MSLLGQLVSLSPVSPRGPKPRGPSPSSAWRREKERGHSLRWLPEIPSGRDRCDFHSHFSANKVPLPASLQSSREYSPAVNPEGENLKVVVNRLNDYLRPHREEVVLALQEFPRNKSLWVKCWRKLYVKGWGSIDWGVWGSRGCQRRDCVVWRPSFSEKGQKDIPASKNTGSVAWT